MPLAVGAITSSRETIYHGAFGERARGEPGSLDENSAFYVASMAKPITTAAAMKLVEEGRLSLDLPVSRWVLGVAQVKVFERFDDRGMPVYRNPVRAITPRDLMTHSAGFAHRVWSRELLHYEQHMSERGVTHSGEGGDGVEWTVPLLFDPGLRWEYSGTAIDLLGRVIEEITGMSIGSYLRTAFFEPLGMVSTGWELSPSLLAHRVDSYRRRADGGFDVLEFQKPDGPVREYGAGGLYSSSADYLSFLRMLLGGGTLNGHRFLAPETIDEMAASRYRGATVGCLRSTDGLIARDVEFFPGQRKSWGLGFLKNEEQTATGRSAGSLSWFGALNTYFWVDRKRDVAGVFLTQLRPCGDERALSAFAGFESAFYGSLS